MRSDRCGVSRAAGQRALNASSATVHNCSVARHNIHVASVQHHVAGPSQLLGPPAAVLQHRASLLLGRRRLHRAHAAILLGPRWPLLLLLLCAALRALLLLSARLFEEVVGAVSIAIAPQRALEPIQALHACAVEQRVAVSWHAAAASMAQQSSTCEPPFRASNRGISLITRSKHPPGCHHPRQQHPGSTEVQADWPRAAALAAAAVAHRRGRCCCRAAQGLPPPAARAEVCIAVELARSSCSSCRHRQHQALRRRRETTPPQRTSEPPQPNARFNHCIGYLLGFQNLSTRSSDVCRLHRRGWQWGEARAGPLLSAAAPARNAHSRLPAGGNASRCSPRIHITRRARQRIAERSFWLASAHLRPAPCTACAAAVLSLSNKLHASAAASNTRVGAWAHLHEEGEPKQRRHSSSCELSV